MNTATARKSFGYTSLRLDFTRATGSCCAQRCSDGRWELYKVEPTGLEMFEGYAAGATLAELDRVHAECDAQIAAVQASGKSSELPIETSLSTIQIETVRRLTA